MKNLSPAASILPFQPTLCPALPLVLGNVDYQDFEWQLRRIDDLLRWSGLEKSFVEQSLARYDRHFPAAKTKARQGHQQHSYRALRCTVLKGLLGEDYRGMSRRLAECPLFRWFCGLEELAAVRVPGKSTLQDYAHWLPAQTMRPLIEQMTHARRAKDSKKARKKTLRLMKRQVKVVAGHARRHRELLDQQWGQTDWTRPQAQQVLRRIDGVLALLPQAQKQAHERIIGERQVNNADKVLSLYETDTRVIVRGKAGAEVEFGNTLLLAEQKDGLIVDWQLHRESAPADPRQLPQSLQRMEAAYGAGAIRALGTDRGFYSAANQAMLAAKDIYDGICPKDLAQLKKRMEEQRFAQLQRRRSQTEGRIGIFKNRFLGRPLRAKGYEHREMAVSWQVLTHNLWVLARLEQKAELAQAA
jgi:Transposase domain (DUF772)